MAKVIIGRITDSNAIPIDRKTIFGNPYPIKGFHTRDYVCDRYEVYFHNRIENDPLFKEEVYKLVTLAVTNDGITLGCHCYPDRCHGETIKRYIEDTLDGKNEKRTNDVASYGKNELTLVQGSYYIREFNTTLVSPTYAVLEENIQRLIIGVTGIGEIQMREKSNGLLIEMDVEVFTEKVPLRILKLNLLKN